MHQFYLGNTDTVGYNLLFQVSLAFGLAATLFTLFFAVSLLLKRKRYSAWWYLAFATVLLSFFVPSFLNVIMGMTAVAIVLAIVAAGRGYFLAKQSGDAKVQRNYFAFVVLSGCGAAVALAGVVCQVFKLKPSEAFNHNALYHVMMMLGVPAIYAAPLFVIEVREASEGEGLGEQDEFQAEQPKFV